MTAALLRLADELKPLLDRCRAEPVDADELGDEARREKARKATSLSMRRLRAARKLDGRDGNGKRLVGRR